MSQKRSINLFFLTMINLATVLSVRNWPITAEYGLSSISLLLLAMLLFFIPVSLVAAELATGWPKKGGIFVWVTEALGPRMGFVAAWLLWVENVVWYPIVLSFVAATFAYSFDPTLGADRWYQFFMIVGIFWAVTYINLGGMKISGWVSSVGVLLGTILPGLLIISLGATWLGLGRPSEITFSLKSAMPPLSSPTDLAFLAGILLSFCGMEMSAVHAKDVENPQKNYPRAIFLSAATIITLTLLGTLAIAIVIPKGQISLVSGSIEAVTFFLHSFNIKWLVPLIAVLVALGALGSVSTWTAGPCRGLLAAAEQGDLPKIMQKVNRHEMPVVLMCTQACIVTVLALVFIFMPSVNSSFWVLTVLASELYLLMYILLFITGIVLRYKRKDVPRSYKVFGDNPIGMWITSSVGILACLFAIVIGFFPPSQVPTGEILFFELFLILGGLFFCLAPLLIYEIEHRKKAKS